jgi:hypothetical protein
MANRLYNKQVSPKGYKVGGPVKDNKGLKTADSINKPTNYDLASKLPLQKPPMMYKRAYLSSIEDDSKKNVAERKANSISRLEAIEKIQYKNADKRTKGKAVKEIGKIAEQNRKNKEYGKKLAQKELKLRNKAYAKKQKGTIPDTGSEFASGGKVNGKTLSKR